MQHRVGLSRKHSWINRILCISILFFFAATMVLLGRLNRLHESLNQQKDTWFPFVEISPSQPSPSATGTLPLLDLPNNLAYGIELGYMFPTDLIPEKEYQDKKNVKKLQKAKLQEIADNLQRKWGIPCIVAKKKVKINDSSAPSTWKLSLEHSGFEVASPISPSLDQVERLAQALQEENCWVHPYRNMMHINVDAQSRSLAETRNVLKNVMSVEGALDLFRVKDTQQLGGKVISMAPSFNSTKDAYDSLDGSDTFRAHIVLGKHEEVKQKHTKWRKFYRVGLKLDKDTKLKPHTFEFRLWQTSMDPAVSISWIRLATRLVAESYAGRVLEPLQRTPEESWTALFGDLLRVDTDSENFFRQQAESFAHLDYDELRRNDMLFCRHDGESCVEVAEEPSD